jgi:hypothetical protein
LCRHCIEVRKRLKRLEKRVAKEQRMPNFMLDWELEVALADKEDCIICTQETVDGRAVGFRSWLSRIPKANLD